jgi:hypothetical protein
MGVSNSHFCIRYNSWPGTMRSIMSSILRAIGLRLERSVDLGPLRGPIRNLTGTKSRLRLAPRLKEMLFAPTLSVRGFLVTESEWNTVQLAMPSYHHGCIYRE